jgi:hypothetical protein
MRWLRFWGILRYGRGTPVESLSLRGARAHAHFGKLDIVLNNAGYSLVGTAEEASEADCSVLAGQRSREESRIIGSSRAR